MSSKNTSTNPPTLDNPVGQGLQIASWLFFALVLIFVGLRLLGRWRQRQHSPQKGESHFYVQLSDLTIIISLLTTAALLGILLFGVKWGQGIHTAQLSVTQAENVLMGFFLYQVVYKFASGISKVATCFILLAIASPNMTRFILFCRGMVAFILGYCIACSIATIFQCGTNFDSNWIHTHDQSKCFPKPPFWYSHASLNIFASLVMAVLPWWLFSSLTYKRKYIIGVMLSGLALAEVVFGAVRLRGLYQSAHSSADLTYGTSTGIIVSQLEVSFACIAACVPTVIKITEELYVLFCVRVLRLDMGKTDPGSSASGTNYSLRHKGYPLPSLDREHIDPENRRKSFNVYTGGGVDDYYRDIEGASNNSQEGIFKGAITVKKEYHVSSNEGATAS